MKALLPFAALLFLSIAALGQCNGITESIDKFTNQKTWVGYAVGPILQVGNANTIALAGLSKTISPADTIYTILIGIPLTRVPSDKGVGISLLFADGSRLDKSEQPVEVNIGRTGGVDVSASLSFSKEEWKDFLSKTPTDAKIGNNTGTIHPKLAKNIVRVGNCLLIAGDNDF